MEWEVYLDSTWPFRIFNIVDPLCRFRECLQDNGQTVRMRAASHQLRNAKRTANHKNGQLNVRVSVAPAWILTDDYVIHHMHAAHSWL